jgi:hypothetical protein
MKRVRWPLNFKTSGIEKYDGLTSLPIIIRQDLAPRTTYGVSSLLESLMPAVHQ